MLEHVSPAAQEIGQIIITGRKADASPDYVRAADDITKWASASRGRKSVEIAEDQYATR
jgi:hypothetical protein